MPKLALPFSFRSFLLGANAFCVLAYLALIAVVMSYAALAVDFSQSVRGQEAAVSVLEARYLAALGELTESDYARAGYAKPVAEIFVPEAPRAALDVR